ncbi:MAG: hypothetical protein AAFQ60_06835 [Pseudomonadota bacterium]
MAAELFGGINVRQILGLVSCSVYLLAGAKQNADALTVDDLSEFSRICPNEMIHRCNALGDDIPLFNEVA